MFGKDYQVLNVYYTAVEGCRAGIKEKRAGGFDNHQPFSNIGWFVSFWFWLWANGTVVNANIVD